MEAAELASQCSAFWDALARGDREEAEMNLRAIRPPPVDVETYSYASSPGDGEGGGEGDRGTLNMLVAPDTPKSDLNLWNSEKVVGVIQLDQAVMCLARASSGRGRVDFLACVLPRSGSGRQSGKSGEKECTKMSHADVAGKGKGKVQRLIVGEEKVVFAILVPVANEKTHQKRCFSRPLFEVDSFPKELRDLGRHNLLLSLTTQARSWACVFNAYPGGEALWSRHCSLRFPRQLLGDEDSLSDVKVAPGLRSVLTEYHAAGESAKKASIEAASARKIARGGMRLDGAFEREAEAVRGKEHFPSSGYVRSSRAESVHTDPDEGGGSKPVSVVEGMDLYAGGVDVGGSVYPWDPAWRVEDASLGSSYVPSLGGTADTLHRTAAAVAHLTEMISRMKTEGRARDESLGQVISAQRQLLDQQRRTLEGQKGEIKTLRTRVLQLEKGRRKDGGRGGGRRGGGGSDGSDHGSSVPAPSGGGTLQGKERTKLVDEVLEKVARDYVARALFPKLNAPMDFDKYVTHGELQAMNYVSHPELSGKGYVNADQLSQAIPTPTVAVPRVGDRLAILEREVLNSGGALDRLSSKLKDFMEKEQGTAVSAGPYTFKDAMDAELWIKTLGVSDPLQYAPDFRMQLGLMSEVTGTENEQLVAMANASRVGFAALDIAKLNLSFDNPYPETMFKISSAEEYTSTDGRAFQPAFGSAKVFEGDMAYSTLREKIRILERNRDKFQAAIDYTFPPDKTGHAKTHVVFSHILRKGYIQARSFLESFLPFDKMLTKAGIKSDKAWQKVLTYTTAVCKRVAEVRTVSAVLNEGVMLYGMLLATDLLDAFCDLDWIRHPDVSSALVLAALQRDASAVDEAMEVLRKNVPQISNNKSRIGKLETEYNTLKRLNPSLKTS